MKLFLRCLLVFVGLLSIPHFAFAEECESGYGDDGPECYRNLTIEAKHSYGRGVGTIPGSCPVGQDYDAGLCYPQCKSGYYGVGPVCWQGCPSGYADHGATCYKHLFSWFWKSSYGRGVGKIPGSCPGGQDYDAGLCYAQCKTGYSGVGPVCWEQCDADEIDDGAFCRKTADTYAKQYYDASPVHEMAQGCYAIQSPVTGRFLKKYTKGGLIDDGLGYHFENVSLDQASHFFMKPSGLGSYMLTDKDGRYLASHLPAEISAGRYAGDFADWRTTVIDVEGEKRFKFWSKGLNLKLRHNHSTNSLYFFDLLNPANNTSEDNFRMVKLDDEYCTDFPEISTNVHGDVTALKGDVNAPIRGIADIHVHITSNEFMGGKMMHGKPFHPHGVASALEDGSVVHGPSGSLDLLGNLMGETGDINNRHDTRGWPDFPWWPNRTLNTHTGFYYKWLERAHLGGVRLILTDLVENEVLCKVQSTINPASWINPNSCNVMDSIRLQAQRLRELQDYVDAQAGGIGKGFFRLVRSPSEARQVIADGKMAVVMGVEASETFNCGKKDTCTKASIEQGLNELYDLGIRSIFPAHRFDNQLSGALMDDGLLNLGQQLSTGYFFETKECSSNTSGQTLTSGFPLLGDVPVIKDIIDSIGLSPVYGEGKLCNKHGLSELGRYLVNRMMDKHMLIEIDHMSADGAAAVLDIAERRSYSGVMSSHSWLDDAQHADRIAQLGGVIARYAATPYGTSSWVKSTIEKYEGTPYLKSVGFSTDMGGLGGQANPRYDAESNPLVYPFTTEAGLTIYRQSSGNKVFDYNVHGMAHYGMMADYIQDLRMAGDPVSYDAVMSFAEAFIQMWERAEQSEIKVTLAGNSWQRLPGGLRQLEIAADGSIWGTAHDDTIWRWNGSNWNNIPGRLRQVSVGSAQHVWGVSSDGNIYRYNGNNGWTQIPGALSNVSVGNDGAVWGVNSSGNIYHYNGNNDWTLIPGSLKQISVGSHDDNRIIGININNTMFKRVGSDWSIIAEGFNNASIAADGTIWATKPDSTIHVSSDMGETWTLVEGGLQTISAGASNLVVGAYGNEPYQRNFFSVD